MKSGAPEAYVVTAPLGHSFLLLVCPRQYQKDCVQVLLLKDREENTWTRMKIKKHSILRTTAYNFTYHRQTNLTIHTKQEVT